MTEIVPHQYKPCDKKCDLYDNFVASQSYLISSATERKSSICMDSTCSIPNVVYMAYSKKCKKQGVGSTISGKPRLCLTIKVIKKNVHCWKIATHFIGECCDEEIPFKYLALACIDVVNKYIWFNIWSNRGPITQKRKILDGHSSNSTPEIK